MPISDIIDGEAGSSVRAKLNQAKGAAFFREQRGDRSGYNLDDGSGTLTLDAMMIDVSGTPTGTVALTMPDGAVLNEVVEIVTSGTWGAHHISLNDTAAQTIKVLQSNVLYRLRWRGTGANPRWNTEGFTARQTGTTSQVISGTGTLVDLADAFVLDRIEPPQITGNYTLEAADQWLRKASSGNVLETRIFLIALHSTPSSSIVITVPDAIAISAPGVAWVIYRPVTQTGAVTIARQTNGTVNGGTAAIPMAEGRSMVTIQIVGNPGSAPDILVKGDTTEDQTLSGALLGNGKVISGNILLQGTRSNAGTALSLADSGGDFVTGGALTIPNVPGWHADLEIGANTHDLTHNSLVLDISAAGFAAGEIYSVRVRASNAIRVVGPAGIFTQANFA